ncbi:dioxygenase family protein [Rufibacter latericius]|uniref:Intradiol ring-cleavage dioxygenases domain-containing protein n=1 Tax=Rufibacter latericius TaxID=2487040 RepID=A0A3M9N0L2_9BACT|nr:hypothetical protein [Rufibacter latericius]RNI31331.1 hypothetical protein EFB08_02050 [Rufibacter latericius]
MGTEKHIWVSGFLLLLLGSACESSSSQNQPEAATAQPVANSCDNPDGAIECCFLNMPQKLTSTMTIAGPKEPGERLVIMGRIFKSDGKTPLANAIVYAYQTDNTGHYSKKGNETGVQKWHGRLHGWCKTDQTGAYEIHSIRPARYPDNSMPAHIHAAIKPENGAPFYISDFVFKDDSLVNEKYLASIFTPVGGTGVVEVRKSPDNTWTGKRDITLTQ